MITLFRWILLKQKEIKIKLLFYTMIDKRIKEINTGELKDSILEKIMPYIAKLIHEDAVRNNETKDVE